MMILASIWTATVLAVLALIRAGAHSDQHLHRLSSITAKPTAFPVSSSPARVAPPRQLPKHAK